MLLEGPSAQFLVLILTATFVPVHVALSKEPRAVFPAAMANSSQLLIPLLYVELAVILQGPEAL
jgi:hypothetical protein